MNPTSAVTTAFPVPTASNTKAVFVQEKIIEFKPSTEAAKDSQDQTRQVRLELAKVRSDMRAQLAEDLRRRQDFDACKKKWQAAEASRNREEKQKELELLGLPQTCSYLLDTAQYAMRQYHENLPKSLEQTEDKDAINYNRAVKRILEDNSGAKGGERLLRDLESRASENVKRARVTKDIGDGVNLSNAKFLKQVEKSTNKDARAQTLRQNLERGTAL